MKQETREKKAAAQALIFAALQSKSIFPVPDSFKVTFNTKRNGDVIARSARCAVIVPTGGAPEYARMLLWQAEAYN